MFQEKWFLVIFFLLFIIMFIICIIHVGVVIKVSKELNNYLKDKSRCIVINLEKNTERLKLFTQRYNNSDINVLELQRFNAVYGKNIDIRPYVTDKAYKQIQDAEENGYREFHYALTRNSIGCFLSHSTLYQNLLKDNNKEFYIIFEDDAIIGPKVMDSLYDFMSNAPSDWDIILFGTIREISKPHNDLFDKVSTFWGLHGYAIGKQGAQKFLNYIDKIGGKIDMQIDSLMSYMTKKDDFNIYSTKYHFIDFSKNKGDTDIQLPIKYLRNVDPFEYEDENGKVKL